MKKTFKTISRSSYLIHLYNRGNRKERIFLCNKDYLFFKNLLHYHFQTNNFDILSYCLLPNHYHILVKQKGKVNIATVMQKISSRYTKYFNKKYNFVGHLFQSTYNCKIITTKDQLKIVYKYIENNVTITSSSNKSEYLFTNKFLFDFYVLNFIESNTPIEY